MICFRDLKFATLVLSFLSLCFVLFIANSLNASSLNAQDNKLLPSPDRKELKKATASIRKLLAEQYRDSSPEGRVELLKLLQTTADESANNPLDRYALLSECIYAASVFNAVDAGWSACSQIESNFDVDELPHIGFIKQIKTKLSQESAEALYSNGVKLSHQLIEDDRFVDAGELAKTLGAALKKSLPHTKPEIDAIADRAKILARKFKQIQDDLAVLADDPSSEQANQNVGEFYCLQKSDLKTGLPFLAKGTKGPIRELAKQEAAKGKATSQQRLEIADGWWELAQNKKFKSFKKIANNHYRQILNDLEGLTKIKVEQRINEALTGDPNSTIAQLTNHTWKIEWQSGWVWEGMHLSQDHLILSSRLASSSPADGKNHKFEIRKTPVGIIVWPTSKTASYELILSNGQLICSKLDRNGKLISNGIGYRMKSTNDQ